MDILFTSLVFYLISLNSQLISAKHSCGFPGAPAYGHVKPDRLAYSEDAVVIYSCRAGYILLGSSNSRCNGDGSWSEEVPVCDDSMTNLAVAFSTPTIPGHPAEFAIDRDKSTCAYMKPKGTRWYKIDLGANYNVLSVEFTMASIDRNVKFSVYIIKTEETISSYRRCASFSGKFDTETVLLSCAEGNGVEGQQVHIEDHAPEKGIFEVCEVAVQVERDSAYDCGRPSQSLSSFVKEQKNGWVEYGCLTGYELKGNDLRYCLHTGQWTSFPPICKPIPCHDLDDLENGNIQIIQNNDGPPKEGAVAIYKCDEAYEIEGSISRFCLNDGSWSETAPRCKSLS